MTEFRGRGPKAGGTPVSAAKEQPPDPDHNPEQLVIVEIIDGIANQTLVHLPAHRRLADGVGGPTFDRYDFSPPKWPSKCRRLDTGYVYVRAGMLENAPICRECVEAA